MNVLNLEKYKKHLQNQNLENQTNLRKIKQNYSKDEPKEELVEDFNVKIRKARESKNLSREELGQKIYEKVSVINRIESGKMIPDIRLTKKLENALNITLIENVEELDLSKYTGNPSQGRTLGNVVKIKKR